MSRLSDLPSVERLLQRDDVGELIKKHGRPLTRDAIRLTLDEIRGEFGVAPDGKLPEPEQILTRAASRLSTWERSSIQPVINATGVILHTNLGRAPLSDATVHAMNVAARSYATIEFDLETGKRGSRLIHAEAILKQLLNVEAAVVVNNNAAAVLLVLAALASRRRVVIARSQLVEIGGGFRVPDVMKQSGARLVEIGTTNKVRLADYDQALGDDEGVFLWVHRSNFKIVGFTEEPTMAEIVAAAHAAKHSVIADLGSGALLDTAQYGLTHEPTVQEALAAGADIVTFSGDKLLGGPQAGVIVGKADLVARIRKHPLARALRADKTCQAGLAATLLHFLHDEAPAEIPVWRMIAMPLSGIQARAQGWADQLGSGVIIASQSTVGGGSLPGETLGTYVLALDVTNAGRFVKRLREAPMPIIARTERDRVLLDPRTVFPEQDGLLVSELRTALSR